MYCLFRKFKVLLKNFNLHLYIFSPRCNYDFDDLFTLMIAYAVLRKQSNYIKPGAKLNNTQRQANFNNNVTESLKVTVFLPNLVKKKSFIFRPRKSRRMKGPSFPSGPLTLSPCSSPRILLSVISSPFLPPVSLSLSLSIHTS